MGNTMSFTFSDTVAGYVSRFDEKTDTLALATTDGRNFQVHLKSNTYAQVIRNLEQPYQDCTQQMRSMLVPGRYLYVYGIYYPEHGEFTLEAQYLVFPGRKEGEFLFEKQDWWIRQIASIAGGLSQLPHYDQAFRRKGNRQLPPGDRHHLAAGLRVCHRVSLDGR
jgi:hypothetical protein